MDCSSFFLLSGSRLQVSMGVLGNGFLQNSWGEILTILKSVGALTGHSERLMLLPEQFSVSSNLFTLFLPGHDWGSWHGSSSILQLRRVWGVLLLFSESEEISSATAMQLLSCHCCLGFSTFIQSTSQSPVRALWNIQAREMSWLLSRWGDPELHSVKHSAQWWNVLLVCAGPDSKVCFCGPLFA